MTHVQCGDRYGDDPEPSGQGPAGRLRVPVRPAAHGCAGTRPLSASTR